MWRELRNAQCKAELLRNFTGEFILPLMRFGRGQLMRLSVGMTGKNWLSGSVAGELRRRGDSVVGVSKWDIPFQRGQ